MFGLSSAETADLGQLRVRFDEFYGVPTLDAAKRYLRKAPDARPFDEIVQAVRAGGGKVDNEEELKKGLSRSTFDIVKIGDRYGAIEKYPHIKRGGAKRRPVPLTGDFDQGESSDEQRNESDSQG